MTPEGTRRVVPRTQLLEGLPAQGEAILQRLVSAKMVLVSKSRGGEDEGEVELVHDSLISGWEQLARWIDESRGDLAFLTEVGQTAELWIKRGCREEEVWYGEALADALRSFERCSTEAPEHVRRFLEAGRAKEQGRLRRRKRRLVAFMASTSAAAIIAVVAALVIAGQNREVSRQKDRAEQQGAEARRRLAEAQREGARAAHSRGELLEARAKLRSSLEIEVTPSSRALWWRLSRSPLFWKASMGARVQAVALSPDGKTAAAACQDRTVRLFDVDTRALQVLRGHKDQVFSVAYSPDGARLASADIGGQVRLWEPSRGTSVELVGHRGPVLALSFSVDGKVLASGSVDRSIRLWRVATGAPVRALEGHKAGVRSVAFGPRGIIASGSMSGAVRLWDSGAGALTRRIVAHKGPVAAMAFSDDGGTLATGGHDGTIKLWTVATGARARMLAGHRGRVTAVAFRPGRQELASASWDRTIRTWRLDSGAQLTTLRGHEGSVTGLSYGSAGAIIASSSWDGTVRLWHAEGRQQAEGAGGHSAGVNAVRISPNGKAVASASEDKTVRIWDLASGRAVRALEGHTDAVMTVAFSPDGALMASGGQDGTIRLWDPRSGEGRGVMTGHAGAVFHLAFTAGGSAVVSGGKDRTVRLWDLASRKERARLEGHTAPVLVVATSPDGRTAASGGADKTIRLWNTRTGRGRALSGGHAGYVYGLSFSGDGRRLVSGAWDGAVLSWDLASGKSEVLSKGKSRVYRVAHAPVGMEVGAAGAAQVGRLLSPKSDKVVALRGHRSEVNDIAFGPRGELVVTAGDDGTVRTWRARDGRPHWRTAALTTAPARWLTHRGWRKIGGGGVSGLKPWQKSAAQHALQVATSPDGATVCIRTLSGAVELWDGDGARARAREVVPGLEGVLGLPGACLALTRRAVGLLDGAGAYRDLLLGATAMARAADGALVAAGGKVISLDRQARQRASVEVGKDVRALLAAGRWFALGYAEGTIALVPTRKGGPRPAFAFDSTPSSPVVRLTEGPAGTLVAGFANGVVGIWDLSNGSLLKQSRLHGSVEYLVMKEDRLVAATDLGDSIDLDLSLFNTPACDLLASVWRQVPVVWEGGLPVRRGPPASHRCNKK